MLDLQKGTYTGIECSPAARYSCFHWKSRVDSLLRASKFKQITRSSSQVKLERVFFDPEEWPRASYVHTVLGIVRSFLVKLFAKLEALNWNVLTESILPLIYNFNTSWVVLWCDYGKSQVICLPLRALTSLPARPFADNFRAPWQLPAAVGGSQGA